MIFTTDVINENQIKEINNFFSTFENDNPVEVTEPVTEDVQSEEVVYKYISTLVSDKYRQSVEDIENTHLGNRRTKKRNLQQIMKESFFAGANRFGNNFIA